MARKPSRTRKVEYGGVVFQVRPTWDVYRAFQDGIEAAQAMEDEWPRARARDEAAFRYVTDSVIDWEGAQDEDGQALPYSPENLRVLFDPYEVALLQNLIASPELQPGNRSGRSG
jgi:hypothetical protein